MRVWWMAAVGVAVVAAFPAGTDAGHVGIQATVGATLESRASSRAWRVRVTWAVTCTGAGSASFSGDLNLVESTTGERVYLGGVSSVSGTAMQLVYSKARWQYFTATFRINCWDNATIHGSDTIVVTGGGVHVPPLGGDRNGSTSGGGDGGSGGGAGAGDPTEALRSGGCARVIVGTDDPDTLAGTAEGEIVFGRGGGDSVRAGGGHDCVVGGAGNDSLRGEAGDDRLTGGDGADTLVGGAGTNRYDAGRGNDVVDGANRRAELVDCGAGRDRATVDRRDRVRGCERVRRR